MLDRRPSPLVLPALRSRLSAGADAAFACAAGPRTPECTSPLPYLLASAAQARRKSSDSWNSLESGDYEPDREWKHEHLTFLLRALDALPSHTYTPFTGAPPTALLDRISRGITSAKGDDWPHTIRQTRIKLLELARTRLGGAELVSGDCLNAIIDGGPPPTESAHPSTPGARKPLQRQSSMDFMSSAKIGTRATEGFGRFSRVQHGLASPTTERRPSLLNPTTPSSTTLNSGTAPPRLTHRSSAMTLSSVSTNESYSGPCLVDPRVHRIRHSGSFGDLKTSPVSPGTPPVRRPLKRAPSNGSNSARASVGSTKIDGEDMDLGLPAPKLRPRKTSTSSQASDEEDKARSKKAKKARRRSPSPPPSLPPSSLPCSPAYPPPLTPMTPAAAPVRRRRANPLRNPSMFGPELPHLAASSPVSACPSAFPVHYSAAAAVSAAAEAERESRRRSTAMVDAGSPSPHRLRRVKGTTFAPVGRRISFGSLRAPQADENVPVLRALPGVRESAALEGAFQLH